MIAALFVATGGCYFNLPDVDPWDEARDARGYSGSDPVIAHPPCARWSKLAGLVQARYGHKVGDDGGCFKSALATVRRAGGVLEHPAHSKAWAAHGMQPPMSSGGWTQADQFGGRSCSVEQGHYGHRARKATWLYCCRTKFPKLIWGPSEARVWVSWMHNHDHGRTVERMGRRERLATPHAFREVLLSIADSVQR